MRVAILHTAFIGDLALAGLLVEALHVAGHVVVLASNRAGLALYARDRRVAERVLIRKGKGIAKVASVMDCARALNALRLDVLLVPHRSLTSSLIARLARVPRIVGFGSASGAFLFDEKAPYPAGMHESLRMLDLAPSDLVPDNVRATLAAHGAPILRPEGPPRALFAAHPRLVAPGSRYFVVSPGSVWATKQYPAEAFADAARLLLEGDPHLLCVLSGGPSDAVATNAFLTAAAAWPEEHRARLVDAIDCIPLEDLPAVLASASVSLANDSAPLHVACGVGTPVVGVYGPTSTDTGYGPSGTRARAVNYATEHGAALACQPCSKHGHGQCPLGHFRCMRLLPATTVARVAREVAQPFEEVIHSESAAPR